VSSPQRSFGKTVSLIFVYSLVFPLLFSSTNILAYSSNILKVNFDLMDSIPGVSPPHTRLRWGRSNVLPIIVGYQVIVDVTEED